MICVFLNSRTHEQPWETKRETPWQTTQNNHGKPETPRKQWNAMKCIGIVELLHVPTGRMSFDVVLLREEGHLSRVLHSASYEIPDWQPHCGVNGRRQCAMLLLSVSGTRIWWTGGICRMRHLHLAVQRPRLHTQAPSVRDQWLA